MTAGEFLVPADQKAELAVMMRDYIATMAEFVPGVSADDPYPDFDRFWTEPASHWPFWLKVEGANAGLPLSGGEPRPAGPRWRNFSSPVLSGGKAWASPPHAD